MAQSNISSFVAVADARGEAGRQTVDPLVRRGEAAHRGSLVLRRSPDFAEGMRAFLDKRPASFARRDIN
jgi:enoyl-CoA hydratase/carnithine racemase